MSATLMVLLAAAIAMASPAAGAYEAAGVRLLLAEGIAGLVACDVALVYRAFRMERRDSARRALSAREEERRCVARDLHDDIGQALTAVLLELQRVSQLPAGDLRPGIASVRESVRATLEGVGRISSRLRPQALDDLGLADALAALAIDMASAGQIQIARQIDGVLPRLSAHAELVLYRVAQEALTNVLRHANATRASLHVHSSGKTVVLTVADDGRGFSSREDGTCSGLRGMRERAESLGARLDVQSRAGTGTTVTLTVRGRS